MAKSLKKNFLYNALYQILIILTPLVTTPYLSRVLGAEMVGVYSYTYSITNYFVMFATLGMSTYGVRAIAQCGDDREKRSRVFWGAYFSQLAIGAVVILVYVLYAMVAPQGGLLVTAIWGLWVISAVIDGSWLFFGREEFAIPTAINTTTKLLSLVVIFGFVHSSSDLWAYCLAIGGSYFANQACLLPLIGKHVDFRRPSTSEVLRHVKPSLILFIPVIAISLYTSMDKLMLGLMAGMEQTGFYEYSEKLSKMPLALVTAMGTVMLPRMSSLLASGAKREAVDLLGSSIWAMLMMAFAFGFGVAAISPEFATVFLGDGFSDCWIIMCVLSAVLPLVSVTNVLGRQYLLPTNRDKLFTVSVCVGAGVNVVLNLILIPLYAALGASVATVVAEASVLVAQATMVRGELPLASYVKNALPFVVIGGIMLVGVRLCAGLCNGVWGMSVQGLVLEVLVGVLLYAVLTVVWCVCSHDENATQTLSSVMAKFGCSAKGIAD